MAEPRPSGTQVSGPKPVCFVTVCCQASVLGRSCIWCGKPACQVADPEVHHSLAASRAGSKRKLSGSGAYSPVLQSWQPCPFLSDLHVGCRPAPTGHLELI